MAAVLFYEKQFFSVLPSICTHRYKHGLKNVYATHITSHFYLDIFIS